MEKRILVIGATGLLGEPVAKKLQKSGFTVRIMVRDIEIASKRFGDGFEIVRGDITDNQSLEHAASNCFGVHINLSGEIELVGAERVAAVAAKQKLQRITYISGTSVAPENTWVPVIRRKFFAEQAIRESGVPYTIFCPTWFMEVLPKYIRGNRAFVFGKQTNPYHLIAAEDYARMVAAAYENGKAVNKRLILHGPEGILFRDAVTRYCQAIRPEIKRVSTMPYWLAAFISALKGKPELKLASDFMAAFEKIGELGNPAEANDLLGNPQIRLDEWLNGAFEKGRRDPVVHLSAAQTTTYSKLCIGSRVFSSEDFVNGGIIMIRDSFRRFGCGMNKAKHGAALKHCEANALDFFIYRMGAEKIKRMIRHKYDITLDIEGKSLDQITREAMNFEYQ